MSLGGWPRLEFFLIFFFFLFVCQVLHALVCLVLGGVVHNSYLPHLCYRCKSKCMPCRQQCTAYHPTVMSQLQMMSENT